MTGADFTEVDIDLLADYVGGVLDGTPEAAAVAARIDSDPQWREAHAAMVAGMTVVGTELNAMGAAPEPMPADVAARIDAALSAAWTTPADATFLDTDIERTDTDATNSDPTNTEGTGTEGTGTEAPSRRRHLVAVPSSEGSRVAASRRWRRWAAPIGVAAGVLAFAGFGVNHLVRSSSDSADSAQSAGVMAAAGSAVALPDADHIVTSDTDYGPGTLEADGDRALSAPAPKHPEPSEPRKALGPTAAPDTTGSGPEMATDNAAGPLQRLRPRDALQSCLDAIAQEYGSRPVAVQSIDYARFAHTPALIVRFTGPDGSWAWVSGPACGAPGAGAATRFRVKVG
ncbi:hypothetical protein [Krasilnikovia sp. MM14-A1259]|uniref:hypothetical protein n=1 Tax=Krasilnikovia sp. MM14-A1259 TaxID=3373539 RepID=UPI00381DADEB